MSKRIIYQNEEGGVSVMEPFVTSGLTVEQIAAKDVPDGLPFEIVDMGSIPTDRTFRNAWIKSGATIETDLPKAKQIAHTKRRAKRDEEFKPLDRQATIPAESIDAETARVVVREKYAIMQTEIDAATDEASLKTSINAILESE